MTSKHLPWDPEWLAQIWMRIGAAVWQGQHLEDTLAKFLVLAFQMSKEDARESALDALADAKRLTLGAIVSKLRSCAQLPENLDADLELFKKNRNWVVHDSYIDVVANLQDPARLSTIVARIEQTDLLGHRLTGVFWDVARTLSDEFEAEIPFPGETARQIRDSWSGENQSSALGE